MDDLTECEKLYMDKAFEYAEEALKILEVPVGCIFVYEDEVIAIGKNDVNRTRNATRHAEMICIDAVVSKYNEKTDQLSEVFKEVSVYVTVEPCIMCISALYNLNVKSIVFGCNNDRFGGQTVFDVASVVRPNVTIKGGYRAEKAMNLLKEFYKGTNPNAPESKVKVKSRSNPD